MTLTVYPRVYGETGDNPDGQSPSHGLSPRVRGNQLPDGNGRPPSRSIPACTGKPVLAIKPGTYDAVYPRVYGETALQPKAGPETLGLSPRVRGNQTEKPSYRISRRSIPACTGKPGSPECNLTWRQVYPRVYGETSHCRETKTASEGLSPRVRGNHEMQGNQAGVGRSIPACTGKPGCGMGEYLAPWVYPRVYGETAQIHGPFSVQYGLSPRVRGNPNRGAEDTDG